MYTVGEMARMLHVPASTLRYYDKQGLLPFVERSPGGIRVFKDSDFEWLRIIECMKKAGMSLKDIRIYIELAMQGDSTIDARLAMFRRQQDTLRALTQQPQQPAVLEHALVLRDRSKAGQHRRCKKPARQGYPRRNAGRKGPFVRLPG